LKTTDVNLQSDIMLAQSGNKNQSICFKVRVNY
jgi:hypothetical protein